MLNRDFNQTAIWICPSLLNTVQFQVPKWICQSALLTRQQMRWEIVTTAANEKTNGKYLREKLSVVCLGVADRRRCLWLIESIASFILLAHAIDDEHDYCDGENQTNNGQTDTHCNSTTAAPRSLTHQSTNTPVHPHSWNQLTRVHLQFPSMLRDWAGWQEWCLNVKSIPVIHNNYILRDSGQLQITPKKKLQ